MSAGIQRGFTLVEALVALVVLSVGLIGVAALHGQSLSATRSAQFRSVAVELAADMADRIRVNRAGGAAYAGAPANHHCDPSTAPAADCTPEQMAAHDLFVWDQLVQASLPNGQWSLSFDGSTLPPAYTIDVYWDEVGAPSNPVSHRTELRLPPF